ncbi:DoxX family membrane protein [Rhodobacterales bacterium HKCCE3408]|nr:DoxX family membrane protein [Rhodobacterales bacterium HKCCE3408]
MIDQQTAPYAALALRLASGAFFLVHGLTKVFVFTIPGTVGFFESVGYPGLLAYAVILIEVFGGLALILGLAVRPVAIAQAVVLLGATTVHFANGFDFTSQGGGWEYPVFWAVASIAIALMGPGAYALKLPVATQKTA